MAKAAQLISPDFIFVNSEMATPLSELEIENIGLLLYSITYIDLRF
jgi:hypothetical protein